MRQIFNKTAVEGSILLNDQRQKLVKKQEKMILLQARPKTSVKYPFGSRRGTTQPVTERINAFQEWYSMESHQS